jgi:NitT/TauT family transport system substrate-binding protein
MKKFTIFLLVLFTSFSILLTGCDKNENLIRVNEVTHSIFYAPLYIAINNDYFAEEGLEIELTNGGGSDASMTALLTGAADIALLGPETAVYVASQGRQDLPIIFGQLTKRDGSFLIGRTREPNFEWSDLAGKHIIGGRRGGSPAMSLQYALEQNGLIIDDTVTLDLSVAYSLTASAFEGGLGDYVTMFEPTAGDFVAAGKGYYIASVGEESGEVPFTAFMANRSYLNNKPEKCEQFLKAVVRGYNYLMAQPVDNVVESLMPSFSSSSQESIRSAVLSYKSIDAWCNTPIMDEMAFNRLQTIMQNAGELTTAVSFESIVDNTIAQKVLL